MAADPVVMPVEQDAQQAGLQLGGHIADLVEEQGAALGLLETAAALRLGAGEGAAFVAEQFGFEEVLGNRRRVDGDERLVGPRAVAVQGARDQFLAAARFAGDQHGGVRQSQTADGAEDFLHGWRLAENLRHQPLFLFCTTLVHGFIDRPPDQLDRLIDVEGLGQIFEGTALEGGDRALQIGIGGHDDDRDGREAGLHFLQQLQPRLAGHADVGHQDLRRLGTLFKLRDGLAGRGEALEGDALAGQGLLQDPADGTVVVDDPDRFHDFLAHLVIGNEKMTSKSQACSTGRRMVKMVWPG